MSNKKSQMKNQKIENKIQRHVAFCKRRRGFLKKAIELSVKCDQLIFMIVYDKERDKIIQYSSDKDFQFKNAFDTLNRIKSQNKNQSIEILTNEDYDKFRLVDLRTIRYSKQNCQMDKESSDLEFEFTCNHNQSQDESNSDQNIIAKSNEKLQNKRLKKEKLKKQENLDLKNKNQEQESNQENTDQTFTAIQKCVSDESKYLNSYFQNQNNQNDIFNQSQMNQKQILNLNLNQYQQKIISQQNLLLNQKKNIQRSSNNLIQDNIEYLRNFIQKNIKMMSPQPSTKGNLKIDINEILNENQNIIIQEKLPSFQNQYTSNLIAQNKYNEIDIDFEKDNIFFSDYQNSFDSQNILESYKNMNRKNIQNLVFYD